MLSSTFPSPLHISLPFALFFHPFILLRARRAAAAIFFFFFFRPMLLLIVCCLLRAIRYYSYDAIALPSYADDFSFSLTKMAIFLLRDAACAPVAPLLQMIACRALSVDARAMRKRRDARCASSIPQHAICPQRVLRHASARVLMRCDSARNA